MHPYVYGPKFMWNIDGSVGKQGANNVPADVAFIQWYYTLAANFGLTDASHRQIYKAVKITGTCSGADSDPLVAAIRVQQQSLSQATVDGKVSVVTGDGKLGLKAFFLLRLEARFAVMYPNAWPRLDLIPNCPASVMQVSKYAVPNIGELS